MLNIPEDPLSPWFMMLGEGNNAVVSRIELAHPSQVTERGVGFGSTEADVAAAYPVGQEPHRYLGGDAKYLRVVNKDNSRDVTTILFETDENGIVTAVRNGYVDPVRWVEGCA